MCKRYFYQLQGNIKNKYWIKDQMLPKKVVHKAGEFIGNKIAVQQLSQTMIIMRNKNLLKK